VTVGIARKKEAAERKMTEDDFVEKVERGI